MSSERISDDIPLEYGYPHSNALLQFCLKFEHCKPQKSARHLTIWDVINDYFRQYIAGYTIFQQYIAGHFTLSNQTSRYKIKWIRIKTECTAIQRAYTLYTQAATALAGLRGCAVLPEPSLVANAISIKYHMFTFVQMTGQFWFLVDLRRSGTYTVWFSTWLALTLNAPIATKVVCFSRLLKCLRSLYGKTCEPRSDCSYRSSLFWVHAVCFFT